MELYIRTNGGMYLSADAATVTAATPQAAYDSLLVLDPYDPVRKGAPADGTLRSQGLATLRSGSGTLLAPERGGAGRARMGVTKSGPGAAAQLGYDVFRVFKVGGQKDEPINYGDKIALRFTPPGDNPPPMWMTVDQSEVYFAELQAPGDGETFDMVLPVDMVDFTAEYDDITNGIIGQVLFSGPMLPGGHIVNVESTDASDLIAAKQLLLDGSNTFVLPVAPSAEITPCTPRPVSLKAQYPASGVELEEQVKLEGDRALFLSMKIVGAKKQKSALPIFKGNPAIDLTAALTVDQSAKRLNPNNFPLSVKVASDPALLKNFEQKGDKVDFGKAIKLTFTIQPPKEGTPTACTLMRVRYKLDGKARESLFAVKIKPGGIALDPQG